MLDAMRTKAGGWVAKIFIGLLAASFAVWGVSDVFRTTPEDTVAEVGSRQISVREYNRAFDRQLRQLSQQLGQSLTTSQGKQLGLDRQVLGQLLRDAALEAQADDLNLQISDQSVANRIAGNKQFQSSDGTFNATQFRRLLQSSGLSEQMFVAAERQSMVRAAIASSIERGSAAPNGLTELAHKYRNEQRDVRFFTVTLPENSIGEPSDSDLKSFYDSNQQMFGVPERRVIAVLQVTPETLSDQITISDADIKTYYEDKKASFSTPEKRTVQQIAFATVGDAEVARGKISQGASFSEIAKAKGMSDADLNLGTFRKDALPDPALADAAFSLAKDAVSQPVTGKLSVVLLRVTAIEPGHQQTLEETRDQIKQLLSVEQARDEVLSVYDKIEESRASGQSFDEIARDLSLELLKTPPIDRTAQDADGAAVTGLADATAVVRAAFESDVGVDNDPVTVDGDGYVWFEVRDVQSASTKPLNQAREQAIEGWKARQLRIAVLDKAQEFKKRAEAGEPLAKLAGETNATLETLTGIKRVEASEAFDAVAVQTLFRVREDGFAVAAEGDGKGAKLMQSTPVLLPPFDAGSSEAKSIKQELSSFLTNDLYAQYLADLQRRLGVSINETALSNAAGSNYQRGF